MTEETPNLPERKTASQLVDSMSGSFARLLPSHLREDSGSQWIASVKAILATRPEIRSAAENDLNAFMAALIQASRKGLEPGTDEFYLVPFSPKKGQPRIIQGIEGYKGIVERIYRAGAVSSVIVEVVKSRDVFRYRPGVDTRPQHEVDWFGDRGDLIGAYAYAVMSDGGTSKVVVVGPTEIGRARAKSASAGSDRSPWNTDPEAMWAKTAARRLEKWVPTSSEYRRQKLRDAQAVIAEQDRTHSLADGLQIPDHLLAAADAADEDDEVIDPETGEVITDDIVDAEIVEERGVGTDPGMVGAGEGPTVPEPKGGVAAAGGQPATPPAPTQTATDAGNPPQPEDAAFPSSSVPGTGAAGLEPAAPPIPGDVPAPKVMTAQKQQLRAECSRLGIQASTKTKLTFFNLILGRDTDDQLVDAADLDADEAEQILHLLRTMTTREDLNVWAGGQPSALDE